MADKEQDAPVWRGRNKPSSTTRSTNSQLTYSDGNIIDKSAVEVARSERELTIFVKVVFFENESKNGSAWLNENKLESALFDSSEKAFIGGHGSHVLKRPGMFDSPF